MKRMLLLFSMLSGMLCVEFAISQITPNGNTGQSTTAYTNGAPNDNIYIWCGQGIGTNQASLTATPPSGTGPWTFRWYYHNQGTSSWSVYSTTTGTSSTVSSLPSDGYRVEIFDAGNNLVGCYTAWVWNMNSNITATANNASCNSVNLVGTLATEGSFSYYNPPPPESLINATTNISVCFSANHTYLSDLAFYLVGPAACGSPVILLTPNPQTFAPNPGNCNSGDNVNNVCFSNTTLNRLNVCTAGAPLTGTYGAYGLNAPGTAINWAPLIGCNAAAGGWRVQIYDCIGADVGSLTNANISFSNLTSRCGSPTTITYASGAINSAINDNSCTAASASIFQVPPSANLSTPITLNATTTYLWTASPAMAVPNASTSLTPSVTGIPQGTTTFTLTATVSFGGTTCTYNASTAGFTNTCCTATANAGADVNFCSGGGSAVIGSPAVAGRTYSWSPATGLSSATAAQPTVTLNNGTGVPQSTNYTLTVTNVADGGCTATDIVTVTAQPLPVITATPASQTICSGATTGISLTSVPAGSTFGWTVAGSGTSGATAGSGTSISQVLNTTSSLQGTVIYSITPTLSGCVGLPVDVTITVNPNPSVTATPAAQTICSGETTGISLTSVPAGATFAWTISQTSASGASNGSGSSIAQALTATGTTAGTVTYSIIPTIGSCVGIPVDVVITVNPTPVAVATPALQTICSGTGTGIALTSVPAGASFAWTVAESGTSGAAAGSGTSISQTLVVTGLVQGTTTYTVIPTIGTCVGLPINVPVTVNPTPTATATPSSETICSGTASGISLTSVPAGSTFAWTVSQTGVTGATAGSGNSIAQTLSASGTVQGTVTYTITPTLGICVGAPVTATIAVNPTPVATATPSDQTICSGTATGISLTSVPAGATFAWTVAESGISGGTAGSGNSIVQTLSSTGTAVGTATYTIIPTLTGCPGLPVNATVTVNPIPSASATPSVQTICSGATTGISLTSVPAGSTFGWTVAESGTSDATAGSGTSIAQVLNTTSSLQGTATYSITPTLAGCVGLPVDVTITVNPNPVVTATPASQMICSGETTGITLTSVPAGATFAWTISEAGVSGVLNGTGTSIAQSLSTTNPVQGTVTYTITPTIGTCVGLPQDVTITVNPTPVATSNPALQTICSGMATGISMTSVPVGSTFTWTVAESGTSGATAGNGTSIAQTLAVTGLVQGTTTYTVTPTIGVCSGLPISVPVTVNPTPSATATPSAETICSGQTTGIALTSSPAGSTFSWAVAQTGVTGATSGSGNNIAHLLTSTGTAQGNATYTITPTLGACVGAPITVVITVNPTPVVSATPSTATICSGTATGINLSSTPAGATYAWTVNEVSAGGSLSGTGSSIIQTLTAAGTAVGTVTYHITPTLGVCVGLPVDAIITVNPLPTVIATPASQSICTELTTNIALTSTPSGSTFTWTTSQTGVSGATNGTGNTIAQVLTSTNGGTATYAVTPSLNGCLGPIANVVITVNPKPILIPNPATTSMCAGSSVSLGVSGAATYVWTPASGLNTTTGSSVNAAPAATQIYAIQGTDVNGCIGTTNISVTVNPIPVTTVSVNDTICLGESVNLTAAGANTYSWIPTTGLNMATGNNVIANPSVTTTYTVTGTSFNCSSTATVQVFVKPLPPVSAGSDITICNGQSVILSGNGANSYQWTGGVTDNVPFTPAVTTAYTVIGTGVNQCVSLDSVTVTVVNAPNIAFVPSAVMGCAPFDVTFQNNTTGAVNYTWDFGNGNMSTGVSPSTIYETIGCFDVTLTASTTEGCISTATFPSVVCIEASPEADFIANPSRISTNNPVSSMINLSENATSYSWTFGDGSGESTAFSPEHTFPSEAITNYEVTLVAYNASGCTDTARVRIEMYEDVVYFIPNTFTPDGDDYNQTFKPIITSGHDPYSYTLLIYSRWGEVLFESHDVSVGWSGTYQGGSGLVMDGTYGWTIEFKVLQTGERKKLEGHVNVLR